MDFHAPLNRRSLFRTAGAAGAALLLGAAGAPRATAQGRVLGTVVDYAAGVPSAASIKAAGHLGAVRYVSRPRPGTAGWMTGKPVSAAETRSLTAAGLAVASVYQYGKAANADWKQGAAGAAVHAPQAVELHAAAGGPGGRPIYVAIDDNPTRSQYTELIRPYLRAFQAALSTAGLKLGVYGNYSTVDWAIADGLGSFYWQHNWGSAGRVHPRCNLHQRRIDADSIDGVGVDVNDVYTSDWGQWTPGAGAAARPERPERPAQPHREPAPDQPAGDGRTPALGSSDLALPNLDSLTINLPGGSSVTGGQIREAAEYVARLSS